MPESRPEVQEKNGDLREVNWGGCWLSDRGSVDEIDALIGRDIMVRGERGVVEAIWLIDGEAPWPGPPWPRPLYRVRWRLTREEAP